MDSAGDKARYHSGVVRRLYIHNFRCLENFELPIAGQSSVLLIGNNGSGKTTVGLALEVLQQIARGTNRVGSLVGPGDFARGRTEAPMRFEIEVELNGATYEYALALMWPDGSREPGVHEEKLAVGGMSVYSRIGSEVRLARMGAESEAQFRIAWHLIALPVIQAQPREDPLAVFKEWLARTLILRPIPSLIKGDSATETLQPGRWVNDFAAWFSGVLAETPAAYGDIKEYLKQLMPDLKEIMNPRIGKDSRSMIVQFSNETGMVEIPFEHLSDGEKCFMISALVLAANARYGPLLCFWDEPDNYLALSEVGHFVAALRQAFQSGGQFVATSHNPEAIRRFSDENTLLLHRNSHLEPTVVRPLSGLHIEGDLVGALLRGDVEP